MTVQIATDSTCDLPEHLIQVTAILRLFLAMSILMVRVTAMGWI